ncbi:hypothetical protein BCV70DRAFT_25396 [Testicularia cyperi]|uniref:Uncharacterized protein n=1 Tax=Testicularia cyperi TaxID=1882483 RepID=A0A317XLA1_9BASI|nr:hypothetical protein BCV70DRAFT_25396 [Testicularia cyperi]
MILNMFPRQVIGNPATRTRRNEHIVSTHPMTWVASGGTRPSRSRFVWRLRFQLPSFKVRFTIGRIQVLRFMKMYYDSITAAYVFTSLPQGFCSSPSQNHATPSRHHGNPDSNFKMQWSRKIVSGSTPNMLAAKFGILGRWQRNPAARAHGGVGKMKSC